jgi:hypothetical protein
MRINIYSQELILDASQETAIEMGTKLSNTGIEYSFVRLFLHSSERLHHPPRDDDRSAITFWVPKSMANRFQFANQLRELAELVMKAPLEIGLD